MPVDPVGLDFAIASKTVDKPNRTAVIVGDVYWNGTAVAQFTLSLDAKDQSKAVSGFAYGFQMIPA